MTLFNFTDFSGPPVSAAFLNALDLIRQGLTGSAAGAMTIPTPASGISLTVNGIVGGASNPTGAAISAVANGNASSSITIQNQFNGTQATTILSVQDGSGNFGFMELQSALCNAQETGGVTGLAVNIGSSANFPVQICTLDTVRALITGAGNWTFTAPSSGLTALFNQGATQDGLEILYAGAPGQTSLRMQGDGAVIGFFNTAVANVLRLGPDKGITNSADATSGAILVPTKLNLYTNNSLATPAVVFGTANVTINQPLGINSVAPPAQVTGFGTPTGTGVINNFPGATATLAQCSQAIAEIIKDLKAFGLYGT